MPTVPISMRKLKEILRLKYGVGLSHRQIGRSLAISPSVVSRYANRAAQLGIKQRPLPTGWDDTKLKHAFLQTQVKMKKHSLPDWATVHRELLTRLNNSDLLLLDDWGLEPLSSEQRSDLLEIVDLMYQRGSIIVVSQLPVENWYKMIGDSTHADAILDRLVHGSIKIELKGESMRKIQSPLTEEDQ